MNRDEAEKLLTVFAACVAKDANGPSMDNERRLKEAFEACLAAMLSPEPDAEITAEKPAIPRMKPRITREEAMELLDKYAGASIDQWSKPMSEDGLYKQASAFEACLAAMLRSETDGGEKAREPVAWVPVHPRNGPLWASAIDSLDCDHPKSYPLMPLYASPPAASDGEKS